LVAERWRSGSSIEHTYQGRRFFRRTEMKWLFLFALAPRALQRSRTSASIEAALRIDDEHLLIIQLRAGDSHPISAISRR